MVENCLSGYNSCMFAYGQVNASCGDLVSCFFLQAVTYFFDCCWSCAWLIVCRRVVVKHIPWWARLRKQKDTLMMIAGSHQEFLTICLRGLKRC